MVCYLVILILTGITCLVVTAAALATSMHKLFCPPPASAWPVVKQNVEGDLEYDPPAPPSHKLAYRHPRLLLLYYLPINLPVLLLTLPMLFIPLNVSTNEWFRPIVLAGRVALGCYLVGYLVLIWVAFRGAAVFLPRGTYWPRLRLWVASLVMVYLVFQALYFCDKYTNQAIAIFENHATQTLTDLRLPEVAEAENAAGYYRQAYQIYRSVGGEGKLNWSAELAGATQPPPPFPADLEPAVAQLYLAAKCPVADYGQDMTQRRMFTKLGHLKELRELSLVLCLHALQAAQNKDPATALKDVAALQTMARHAGEGASVVEFLVAVGIDSLAIKTLEQVLPFVQSEPQLDALVLPDPQWINQMATRNMQGEKATGIRAMADIAYGRDPDTTIPSSESIGKSLRSMPYRILVTPDDLAALEALYNEVQIGMTGDLGPLTARRISTRSYTPLVAILAPSLTHAITTCHEYRVMRQLAPLAITLTRYRLRTEDLPNSWDDLRTAGLLPNPPVDPFDGHVLRFKLAADSFTFYSVGADLADNQGKAKNSAGSYDLPFVISAKPLWELPPTTRPDVPAN